MPTVIHQLADAFLKRKKAAQRKTVFPEDSFMPKSSKQELANRLSVFEQGGTPELLKQAGKEMYENPIVNTAIGIAPGASDIQAMGEFGRSLYESRPWYETAAWGASALPGVPTFAPALMSAVKNGKAVEEAATAYRGLHTAPNREFGAPLHDLTGGGQMYPEDVYSANAARFYGHGGPDVAMDKQTVNIAQSFKGKPDADVTIYRAVPKDEKITAINPGDWVTINPQYAKQHGESNLPEGYKVISQKVKAKDIWTNADSIHEYGYDPQP